MYIDAVRNGGKAVTGDDAGHGHDEGDSNWEHGKKCGHTCIHLSKCN